jgi:(p)ppGpp synthase/HD superfamily hydrolase
MEITTILGESKANVSGANIGTSKSGTAEIKISIDVFDDEHLRLVMSKIGNLSDVIHILRTPEAAH